MSYAANDLESYWMPFTSNRHFKNEQPRIMVEGKGLVFKSHKGHDILDAVSGLFCSPAGHSRPEIAEAVHQQLLENSYTPPFQHGHPAAFELARRVAGLLPGELDHVFFGNSGSEAVETALKIALLYHRRRGEGQRMRIVGRERGYHGVNFAGFSVGGMVKNRDMFGLGIPGVLHMRHTAIEENRFTRGQAEKGAELADDLQRFCDLHGGDTIAACIVEPVGGGIGAYVPPVGYLERLREICHTHGILLIFDEVINGFGRLGENFAAQRFGVQPDMITMAKALTNGAIPMGATACSAEIYKTVTEAAPEKGVEFFHGYTYTAHPAACAAGLATLDIYEKEALFERSKALEGHFLDRLFDLKQMGAIADIRGLGLLGAFDLKPNGGPGTTGYRAVQDLFEAGVLTKVTGDTVILAPAFIAEESDLDRMFDLIAGVIGKY
ncbi:MAG: aminotransferase class III-fold pyridoxal phosphate-dependent enzyme [Rhodospirillales bacterium]|jgi:beta-alanine--pyruvate transaminase|nr:aminotransferase class III-fold pyridoxal phosphate-dependent enzyme [Rhodospirillales bacterium]